MTTNRGIEEFGNSNGGFFYNYYLLFNLSNFNFNQIFYKIFNFYQLFK